MAFPTTPVVSRTITNNPSSLPVPIPPGNTTITVKLVNPVHFGPSRIKRFMTPDVPWFDRIERVPSNCFLLEHPSGRKILWDLGIRSDYDNHAPRIASYLPTTGYKFEHHGDVVDQITDGGVKLKDVEAVIWSHWHWDHIGDPSRFPATTDLVVGPGFQEHMTPGVPINPDSPLLEADWSGRTLREIDFEGPSSLKIGQFPAYDFFEDGSFFLLDSPGHAIGHLCGLVRTTTSPDTFILLGGDVAHYSGIMRPSKHLPMPESIVPDQVNLHSATPLCPGHAWEELQRSRGREPSETLFNMTFGMDIPLATNTVSWLQELDCNNDIFVIIAHDLHVERIVDHFPKSLNSWKEKGWGEKARWAWLQDLKPYFESKGVL